MSGEPQQDISAVQQVELRLLAELSGAGCRRGKFWTISVMQAYTASLMAETNSSCCPQCSAELSQSATTCWLCDAPCESGPANVERQLLETPVPRRGPWTFSLMSLFAVMTATAVLLGLAAIAPGLAMVMTVLSIPAWIRASTYSRRWRHAGHPLTPGEQFVSFMGSLVVVATMALATIVAFCCVCFPLGALSFEGLPPSLALPLFWGAWGLGIAGSVLLGGILLYRLWIAPLRGADGPPTMNLRLVQYAAGVTRALVAVAGALVGLGIVAAVGLVWSSLRDPNAPHAWTIIPIPGAAGQVATYIACAAAGIVGVIAALSLTRRNFTSQIVLVVCVAAALLGLWLGFPWQFALGSLLIDAGCFAPEQRAALEAAVMLGIMAICATTGGAVTFILCQLFSGAPAADDRS